MVKRAFDYGLYILVLCMHIYHFFNYSIRLYINIFFVIFISYVKITLMKRIKEQRILMKLLLFN